MQVCYRHPNRETGVSCSNCGRPICPDCMTTTSVGMRCPECARERTRVRRYSTGAMDQPTTTYALIVINVVVALGSLLGGGGSAAGLGSDAILRDGALSRATVGNGVVHLLLELRIGHLRAGDADDREVRGEKVLLGEVGEGGHELAARQIAGGAEHHYDAGRCDASRRHTTLPTGCAFRPWMAGGRGGAIGLCGADPALPVGGADMSDPQDAASES